MTDWWNVYENVLELAQWLRENGHFDKHDKNSVERLMDFFEKPWKWEDDWNKMQDEKMKKVSAEVESETNRILEVLKS